MRMTIMFVLLSVVVAAASSAHEGHHYETEGFEYFNIRLDASHHHSGDLGIEGVYRRPIWNGRWWLSQKIGGLSAVVQEREGNISEQGPMALTLWIFTRIFSAPGIPSHKACNSPVFTALSLPSSQLDYALSDHFFIGVSNNTEYVFFRANTGSKGITYTPSLTFTVEGYPYDETCDAFGLQIQFGRTLFWNFEGKSVDQGWTVGAMLSFGYHP